MARHIVKFIAPVIEYKIKLCCHLLYQACPHLFSSPSLPNFRPSTLKGCSAYG